MAGLRVNFLPRFPRRRGWPWQRWPGLRTTKRTRCAAAAADYMLRNANLTLHCIALFTQHRCTLCCPMPAWPISNGPFAVTHQVVSLCPDIFRQRDCACDRWTAPSTTTLQVSCGAFCTSTSADTQHVGLAWLGALLGLLQVIYDVGQQAENFYIILSGRIDIWSHPPGCHRYKGELWVKDSSNMSQSVTVPLGWLTHHSALPAH